MSELDLIRQLRDKLDCQLQSVLVTEDVAAAITWREAKWLSITLDKILDGYSEALRKLEYIRDALRDEARDVDKLLREAGQ